MLSAALRNLILIEKAAIEKTAQDSTDQSHQEHIKSIFQKVKALSPTLFAELEPELSEILKKETAIDGDKEIAEEKMTEADAVEQLRKLLKAIMATEKPLAESPSFTSQQDRSFYDAVFHIQLALTWAFPINDKNEQGQPYDDIFKLDEDTLTPENAIATPHGRLYKVEHLQSYFNTNSAYVMEGTPLAVHTRLPENVRLSQREIDYFRQKGMQLHNPSFSFLTEAKQHGGHSLSEPVSFPEVALDTDSFDSFYLNFILSHVIRIAPLSQNQHIFLLEDESAEEQFRVFSLLYLISQSDNTLRQQIIATMYQPTTITIPPSESVANHPMPLPEESFTDKIIQKIRHLTEFFSEMEKREGAIGFVVSIGKNLVRTLLYIGRCIRGSFRENGDFNSTMLQPQLPQPAVSSVQSSEESFRDKIIRGIKDIPDFFIEMGKKETIAGLLVAMVMNAGRIIKKSGTLFVMGICTFVNEVRRLAGFSENLFLEEGDTNSTRSSDQPQTSHSLSTTTTRLMSGSLRRTVSLLPPNNAPSTLSNHPSPLSSSISRQPESIARPVTRESLRVSRSGS